MSIPSDMANTRQRLDAHVPPRLQFVGASSTTKRPTGLARQIVRDAGEAGLCIRFDPFMLDTLDQLVNDSWIEGSDFGDWDVWERRAERWARVHPVARETEELTPFIMQQICHWAECIYETCVADVGELEGSVHYLQNAEAKGMDYGVVRPGEEGAGHEVLVSIEVKRPKVLPILDLRLAVAALRRHGQLIIKLVDDEIAGNEDVPTKFITVALQMIEDLHHHRAGLSMLNTYDALLLLRRVGQNEFRMSQIVMRDPAEIPLPSRRLPPTGDVVGIGPSTMRIAAEPLGGERPGATDTQTRLIHHRNSVLKLHVALLILARDLQPTTEGWGYWVRHLEMIAKDKRKKEDDDEGGNSSPSKRRKRTNTSTTQGRETDSASGSGVGGAQETGEDAHPHEGVVSRRCANDDAGRDHGHNDHRDRKDNDDNEVYDEEAPSLTLSIDSGDAQSQNHDPKTPTSSTFLNTWTNAGPRPLMLTLQDELSNESDTDTVNAKTKAKAAQGLRTLALYIPISFPSPNRLTSKSRSKSAEIETGLWPSTIITPALCTVSPISSGQLGLAYRAFLISSPSLSPSPSSTVIAKITYLSTFRPDPTKHTLSRLEAIASAHAEAKVYAHLEPLWGRVVPRYHGLWADDYERRRPGRDGELDVWGNDYSKGVLVMVLEALDSEVGPWSLLSETDKYAIVDLYTELHDLGVVHGDVETRHICRRRRVRLVGADPLPDPDPDPSKCKYDLAIIDFDQARIVIPNGPACRQEINEVKARLWQEDE